MRKSRSIHPFPPAAGAAYFELSSAAARTLLTDSSLGAQAALTRLAIPAPLVLPAPQGGGSVMLQCNVELASGALQVSSASTAASSRPAHVTATLAGVRDAGTSASLARPTNATHIASSGLVPLKGRAAAATSAAVALVQATTSRSGLWLDPAPSDCFLQLGQALRGADDVAEVFVPAGLGALHVCQAANTPGSTQAVGGAWATAQPEPAAAGAPVLTDYCLSCSTTSAPLCGILALEAKSMGRTQQGGGTASAAVVQRTECLYEVEWQPVGPAEAAAPSARSTLLWRLPAAEAGEPALAATSAIAAVQHVLATRVCSSLQLQTQHGALLPSAPTGRVPATSLAAAALGGVVRTLNQEAPQLAWSTWQADPHASSAQAAPAAQLMALPAGVAAPDAFGAAVHDGTVYAPRLRRSAAREELPPHHWFPMPRGSLASLAPLPVDFERQLKRDEVLVAVRAVGINFRDVLNVLGMYPGDPGPPGGDCAGVVLRGQVVHEGKTISGPGDAVFGLAAGSLGSHVVTSSKTGERGGGRAMFC